MTQKELLESVLKELSSIKRGMPNGELKSMVEAMKTNDILFDMLKVEKLK